MKKIGGLECRVEKEMTARKDRTKKEWSQSVFSRRLRRSCPSCPKVKGGKDKGATLVVE